MKIYRPKQVVTEFQEIEIGKSFFATFFVEMMSTLIFTFIVIWLGTIIFISTVEEIQKDYVIKFSVTRKV